MTHWFAVGLLQKFHSLFPIILLVLLAHLERRPLLLVFYMLLMEKNSLIIMYHFICSLHAYVCISL